MGHVCIFRPYVGMLVVDILLDKCQRFVTTMELYAAVQLTGKATEALQPSVEAWFKLCSAGYGHLNTSQRAKWLSKTHEQNLSVQTVVEALNKLTPELFGNLSVDVHAHHNL